MKTMIQRLWLKSMSVLLSAVMVITVMGFGSLITFDVFAETVTFSAGETIFYDFTAVSGGVNFLGDRDDAQAQIQGSHWFYASSGGGKVIAVTFLSSFSGTIGTTVMAKTQTGGWTDITLIERTSIDQKVLVINSDGKGYTWATTNNDSNITIPPSTGSKYYRGTVNNWGATLMGKSYDGAYNFITQNNSANHFKIANSETTYDYDKDDEDTSLGDAGSMLGTFGTEDNAYTWFTNSDTNNYYNILFKTSTNKIGLSTYIPNDSTDRTISRSTPSGGTLTLNGGTSQLTVKQNSVYKIVATPDSTHKLTKLVAGSKELYNDSTGGSTDAQTYYVQADSSNATVTATFASRSTAYTITQKQKLGSGTATQVTTFSAYNDSTTPLTADQYVTDNSKTYKFVNWEKTSGNPVIADVNAYSTTIKSNSSNATVTAIYTECAYIELYMVRPPSGVATWSNSYAFLWSNTSSNGNFPGQSIDSKTVSKTYGSSTRTYYYYKYYTEGTNSESYDNIVFSNGSSGGTNQTVDLTTASHNGMFYDMSGKTDGKVSGNWRKVENLYSVTMKYALDGNSASNGLGSNSTYGTTKLTMPSSYDKANNYTPYVGADSTNHIGIKATPSTGYNFVRWECTGGATVTNTTSAETELSATSAGTVTAVYEKPAFTVTYSGESNTYNLSNYTASAQYNNTVSFTLSAKSGYRISSVTVTKESGGTVTYNGPDASNVYTFTMPADNVTVSIQTIKQYQVSWTVDSHVSSVSATANGTTITNGALVDTGSAVVITPTFATGYEFDSSTSTTTHWSDPSYSFTVNANVSKTINSKLIDYPVYIEKNIAAAGTVYYRKDSPTATPSLTLNTSTKDGETTANMGQSYYITVNDSNGYYLTKITVTDGNGSTILNETYTQTSNRPTSYSFTETSAMPATNIAVELKFEAMRPAITNVSASKTPLWAGEPFTATAVFSPVTKLTNVNFNDTNTTLNNITSSPYTHNLTAPAVLTLNRTSGTAFDVTFTGENRYVSGVDPVSEKVTVTVKYTDVQKAYLTLKDLYDKCDDFMDELTADDCVSGYSEFVAAFNAAESALEASGGLPAYDDSNDTFTAQHRALQEAYGALEFKTNTIYVLVKSNYSSNVKVRLSDASKWTRVEGLQPLDTSDKSNTQYSFMMTKEGKTTTGNYCLYSLTYAGKANVAFYHATGASAAYGIANRLSGDANIQSIGYGVHYFDIKGNSTGASGVPSRTEFADLDISAPGNKKLINPYDASNANNTSYSGADIKTLLGTSFSGSLVSTSGCYVTETYTISGPYGRRYSESDVTTISNVSSTAEDKTWQPSKDKPGQYKITVNYTVGTASDGSSVTFAGSKVYALYVAYDEIEVYIDMNGNAGTPTLQYKYQISGTDYHLPFELELETGSEYIHSTSFKISELRDKYGFSGDINDGIPFDKVLVDTQEIGSGFTIAQDALRTGQVWLKADTTNMTKFVVAAYEGIAVNFVALDKNNNIISYMNTSAATPYAQTYTTGSDPAIVMPIESVLGTGIITDDDDVGTYKDYYAAYDTEEKDGLGNPVYKKFSYNVRATAVQEFQIKNSEGSFTDKYYFDGWYAVKYRNDAYSAPELVCETSELNLNDCPKAQAEEYYYAAKYVKVSADDAQNRLKITYTFRDYDNSDGIMEFNETTSNGQYTHSKSASYTKTIKSNETLANLATTGKIKTLAKSNMPKIQSGYFDYTFNDSETPTDISTDSTMKKVTASIAITVTPRVYTLSVNGNAVDPDSNNHHYYQQVRTLTASDYGVTSDPAWYVGTGTNKVLVSTEATFDVRFTGNMTVTVDSDSSVDLTTPASYIRFTYTKDNTDNSTRKVTHNFYVIDRPASNATLIGGGVLFATTDGTNYRQATAGTNLSNSTTRESFIRRILTDKSKFSSTFERQTVENTGFYYLPYANNYNYYRFSDELNAYQYLYAQTAVNNYSEETKDQTLRVYSFLVYATDPDDVSTYEVVSSDSYAEVKRYLP